MVDPSLETALVLYTGPDAETTRIDPATPQINSKSTNQPFCGLSNQGATCYMNSVLQSLFMTPEFRRNIYKWRYNENEHGKPADCIPFQLQKLFAKLQLKQSRFSDTRELTKSFQWDQGNSFEQQDIQEFYTVFCDAIEQTTKGSQVDGFLSDIFEGTILNYIECKDFDYKSSRPENFNHITLTVRNPFEKIYNDSLEKALQVYLKPEHLTGDNQYYLESLEMKVDASKGVKFFKLPKIQTVILNRFAFDYMTMKREKLDDFVSFPFILNMNDYINGYDGIKNKVKEENPEYFVQESKTFSKSKNTSFSVSAGDSAVDSFTATKPGATPTAIKKTKKTTKASSQTASFMKEMRKKGKKKDDEVDVIFVSGDSTSNTPTALTTNAMNENPNSPQYIEAVKESGKAEAAQNNGEGKQNGESTPHQVSGKSEEGDDSTKYRITNTTGEKFSITEAKIIIKKPERSGLTPEDIEKINKEKEEKRIKQVQERRDLIEKYRKDGPLVYDLYAILVHIGGAYGGHYYAFIKSFEDGKWYRFNDTIVDEIDPEEIPVKGFGGSSCGNAYMMMYRQVDSPEEKIEKISDEEIPAYLKEMLEKENQTFENTDQRRVERSANMNIRVFHQLEVKLIQTGLKDTLNDLLDKAIAEYKLSNVDRKNIRLRGFQPNTESFLETYTGRENKTLEELKLFSHKILGIEIKKDEDVFEEFDADRVAYKLALWRPNIPTLEESDLGITKVWVNKDASFGEFVLAVSSQLEIPSERLQLSRKSFSHGISQPDILTIQENYPKSFTELRLFESTLIFAEEVDDENFKGIKCKWAEEFEKDNYRCKIRYNNPNKEVKSDVGIEYDHFVFVDSRQPLEELKNLICKASNLDPNEILIKKGGKMGAEIKNLTNTVDSQNLVSGSSVFLEFGKPSKPGEIRVFLLLATKIEPEIDNFSHKYEEFCELTIDSANKPSEIKPMIAQQLKMKKGLEVAPQNIRIREKTSERMGKVYREQSMKMQQVIDKKQLAIEILDYEDKIGAKEILIVVRLWDAQTYELGPRKDVIIEKNKSLFAFAEKVHQLHPEIKAEDLIATRIVAPWNFNKYTLGDEEWHPLNDSTNALQTHPFFLSTDGYLVIVKDVNQPVREMSMEEMKELGIIKSKMKGKLAPGKSKTYEPDRGGIKIKIKTKADQEKELEQEKLKKETEVTKSETDKPTGEKPITSLHLEAQEAHENGEQEREQYT